MKYTDEKLELFSSEEGRINMKFLGDSEFFDVEFPDNLFMEVQEGDGLEIIKGSGDNYVELFRETEVIHHSSENGETRISNGNLGTFVYTKDNVEIVKESLEPLAIEGITNAVPMKISSDSELMDLVVDINEFGEVDFLKEGEVVGHLNENLEGKLGEIKKDNKEVIEEKEKRAFEAESSFESYKFSEEYLVENYIGFEDYLSKEEYFTLTNKYAELIGPTEESIYLSGFNRYFLEELEKKGLDYSFVEKVLSLEGIPSSQVNSFLSDFALRDLDNLRGLGYSDEEVLEIFGIAFDNKNSFSDFEVFPKREILDFFKNSEGVLSAEESFSLFKISMENLDASENSKLIIQKGFFNELGELGSKGFSKEYSLDLFEYLLENSNSEDLVFSLKGLDKLSGSVNSLGISEKESLEIVKLFIEGSKGEFSKGEKSYDLSNVPFTLDLFSDHFSNPEQVIDKSFVFLEETGSNFGMVRAFISLLGNEGYDSKESMVFVDAINEYMGDNSEYTNYLKENPEFVYSYLHAGSKLSFEEALEKNPRLIESQLKDIKIDAFQNVRSFLLSAEESGLSQGEIQNLFDKTFEVLDGYTPEELANLNGLQSLILANKISKKAGLSKGKALKIGNLFSRKLNGKD
ncbi:hypothetical protein HOD29_01705 [archaeon]|nr:hypothetical protein [archaeon]